MNSKVLNIILMCIIAAILVVVVAIAFFTFSNHDVQPLPMNAELNVVANVEEQNVIENVVVETTSSKEEERNSESENKGSDDSLFDDIVNEQPFW